MPLFQVPEVIDGVDTYRVKDPKLEAHKQVWYISNVLRRGYRVKVESGTYLVEGDGLMPMMFLPEVTECSTTSPATT